MRSRAAGSRSRRVSRETKTTSFPDQESLMSAWREYKKSANETVRNQLVEHYLYLVRFTAERIGAKLPDEVDVDDLMSAGIFGLVDAVDAFDLSRGVKFETFCSLRIRGAILDELRGTDWVPRLVRYRAAKLDESRRALEVELGRFPSDDELAKRLRLTRSHFDKLKKDAAAVSVVSLSQCFSDAESNREGGEMEILPDERSIDPVTEAQKTDVREFITRNLSRAEKLILLLYYYEQMTMKEIGATLDLSESRVSQMHSALIMRLREELGADTTAPIVESASMDVFA